MEARALRIGIFLSALTSMGATRSTPNFVVHAPTPEIAAQIAEAAEFYRKELAEDWLGHELPNWNQPCPIKVKVGQIGAGGVTSFKFDRGHVFDWNMSVQGSLERILDSVLPHEVSHTIFACHFRRPLPRWADEGAATLVEHESERRRQVRLVQQVLNTSRRIPLRNLLAIKEYPQDMQRVLTLYAEGYSLAEFLVQQGGRKRYLEFLDLAHRKGWDHSIQRFYGDDSIGSLERRWNSWVVAGSPELKLGDGEMLASADTQSSAVAQPKIVQTATKQAAIQQPSVEQSSAEQSTRDAVIRSQSPDQAEQKLASFPAETNTHAFGATENAEAGTEVLANQSRLGSVPLGYALNAPDPNLQRQPKSQVASSTRLPRTRLNSAMGTLSIADISTDDSPIDDSPIDDVTINASRAGLNRARDAGWALAADVGHSKPRIRGETDRFLDWSRLPPPADDDTQRTKSRR